MVHPIAMNEQELQANKNIDRRVQQNDTNKCKEGIILHAFDRLLLAGLNAAQPL
jgi:hypothetical protein